MLCYAAARIFSLQFESISHFSSIVFSFKPYTYTLNSHDSLPISFFSNFLINQYFTDLNTCKELDD